MITTLFLTTLATTQSAPNFREIERLKFQALHSIDQGRFVWEGKMKLNDNPESLMKVEALFKGESVWSEIHSNGVKQAVILNSAKESIFVVFEQKAYGVTPTDGDYVPRAKQKYREPDFKDSFDFAIDHDGPAIKMGMSTVAQIINSGAETIDGVEYVWHEHKLTTENGVGNVKQWFKKDTWLLYKLTLIGQSSVVGSMSATVVTTVMITDATITDEDIAIDPALYAGMRKIDSTQPNSIAKREPREGLPDAPSFVEITKLKIEAMQALKSGKFHTVISVATGATPKLLESQFIFLDDDVKMTSWQDGERIIEQSTGPNSWHKVRPPLLAYSMHKTADDSLRSERSKEPIDTTEVFQLSVDGLQFFNADVDQTIFLDYGEQTLDGVECVWYEHSISDGGIVALVKQWFKKGTWLTYMADVEATSLVGDKMKLTAKMKQFEPGATVAQSDLLIDPAAYNGFRLTSLQNPTGLGREAIELVLPSYHEIDDLKFQEMLALASGKFTVELESKMLGELPSISKVQHVFRGDNMRYYTAENGESINDRSIFNGANSYVFHKLKSYMVGPMSEEWIRKDQQLSRLTVKPNQMKYSNTWIGGFIFLNEKSKPRLVGAGEEVVDGLDCVWYEHELTISNGGIIVRQWFKKDTWLLRRLEARVIEGAVLVGTVSAIASVLQPNADVSDKDLMIDPARYTGYSKIDPPANSQ